ncbi:hypothetical protein [Ornithinibacillus scapharcae]|uniref:hypothetical protein n=1 Tax=Ornithinibacillus scapharcae TaxID=1147159 RepID=UPI000225BDDA|nr:hypothetical protein [Ornithinibacillus scapharcae]
MLRAGDIVSGGGKAVVGSLGAIAGAALGPAGALMGAELGSRGGGALGGITARSTAALGQGINSRIQKGIGAHSLSHSEGDSQFTSISKGLGAATVVSGISRQFKRASSSALQGMRNNPSRPIHGALSSLNNELNINDKLKQAGNAIVHPKESFDNYRSANPVAYRETMKKFLVM